MNEDQTMQLIEEAEKAVGKEEEINGTETPTCTYTFDEIVAKLEGYLPNTGWRYS